MKNTSVTATAESTSIWNCLADSAPRLEVQTSRLDASGMSNKATSAIGTSNHDARASVWSFMSPFASGFATNIQIDHPPSTAPVLKDQTIDRPKPNRGSVVATTAAERSRNRNGWSATNRGNHEIIRP